MRYADRTAAEWKNVAYATRRRRRSREQKVLGMIGVAAHECGHINFSNFEKRRIYASGIREGILYPELPEPKNEEEKQVLGELQVCLEQKKEKELRVIRETLLYRPYYNAEQRWGQEEALDAPVKNCNALSNMLY